MVGGGSAATPLVDSLLGDADLIEMAFKGTSRASLAKKGKNVRIGGRDCTIFVNAKKNKSSMMLRVAAPDGDNVVKIFGKDNYIAAEHTIAATMWDDTLTLDLTEKTPDEIGDTLASFVPFFHLRNGVRIFRFDIGGTPLSDLLHFAVSNESSDRMRVTEDGGRTFVCLVNRNWNGYVRDIDGLDEAYAFEEGVGRPLQASIGGAAAANPDIRIYSTDREVLGNIGEIRGDILDAVISAREALSHIKPLDGEETIRVVLKKQRGKKKAYTAYFRPDLFKDPTVRYTDDIHHGDQGAIVLLDQGSSDNSGYTVDPKRGFIANRGDLVAELRHSISYDIWGSRRRHQKHKAGSGLDAAMDELIDDLRFIYTPYRWERRGWLMRTIFEWASPFDSGHPIIRAHINEIRKFIAERGVYGRDDAEELLTAIDGALVRFIMDTTPRPHSTMFDVAVATAVAKMKAKGDDEIPSSLETLGGPMSMLFRMIDIGAPRFAIDRAVLSILQRLGFSDDELEDAEAKLDRSTKPGEVVYRALREKRGVSKPLLGKIGLEYYTLYKYELEGYRTFEDLDNVYRAHARLRKLLLQTPALAYDAPNGKRYATQLEYILDPDVLAEIIDGAIERADAES